jgi:hypothetical protein
MSGFWPMTIRRSRRLEPSEWHSQRNKLNRSTARPFALPSLLFQNKDLLPRGRHHVIRNVSRKGWKEPRSLTKNKIIGTLKEMEKYLVALGSNPGPRACMCSTLSYIPSNVGKSFK